MTQVLTEIAIRPATHHDLPAVQQLFEEWAAEGSCRGQGVPSNEELVAELPLMLVAEDDGQVVGVATGRIFTAGAEVGDVFTPGRRLLELQELFVTAGRRNQGLGGRLLDAMLAEGRRLGATGALLSTASRRPDDALTFYRRHGFEVWTISMFREG